MKTRRCAPTLNASRSISTSETRSKACSSVRSVASKKTMRGSQRCTNSFRMSPVANLSMLRKLQLRAAPGRWVRQMTRLLNRPRRGGMWPRKTSEALPTLSPTPNRSSEMATLPPQIWQISNRRSPSRGMSDLLPSLENKHY